MKIRIPNVLIYAGLLGLTHALAATPARAKASFERTELRVPGTILSYATGDLDGDGAIDLVVSYRRGKGPVAQRFLGVFFRKADSLSASPDLTIRAPSNAAVFDVGDVLPNPGEELVYLTRVGVYALPLENRKLKPAVRIVRSRPLVGDAEEEDLVAWDFVRSLPPDGVVTILVPKLGPIEMFRFDAPESTDDSKASAGAWKRWARVRVNPLSFYDAEGSGYRRSARGGSSARPYSYRIMTIIPTLWFVEQTGDGQIDLVATFEDRVQVHPGLTEGGFSDTPSERRWFRIRTPEEEKRRDNDVTGQVLDVDRNGVADFVVTKIGGGITNLKTETHIYLGRKGGGFSPKPDQVFRDDGFAALVTFTDVDGKPGPEMIHPLSEVSIIAMSRMLVSAELSMEVRVRRLDRRPGVVFETSPTQELDATFGLDFSVGGAIRGAYPLMGIDFDGDGRTDAILPIGSDVMGVHHGQNDPDEPFDDEPLIKLSAPATKHTIALPTRVGQKNRFDVLMLHTDRPEDDGKLTLFRNVSRR